MLEIEYNGVSNTNYQKSNTGFRIGVSVSMIILMLGIVIALGVFMTHTITTQVNAITDLNTPIGREMTKMYTIQQIQNQIFKDVLTYQSLNDLNDQELAKNEFQSYNNAFDSQVKTVKDLIHGTTMETSDEITNEHLNSIITNLNEISSLHSEFIQTANQVFQYQNNDQLKNKNSLLINFENTQNQINLKEILLNDDIEKLANDSKRIVGNEEQKSLTLQIVIILSAGIISLALGYFLHQINKDLVREVIRKTKSLQRVNKRLRRLNILKDDFINIASHELKSPLNPIYGFVELAQNGDIGKEEALTGILKLARQLEEVANRILDTGRIDQGRLQLSYEKFNLSDLVMEIVSTYTINQSGKMRIETNIEKGIEVEADRVRISQVIRNLLNNALKFTNEGQIMITVHSDHPKNFVEVSVRDTGSGIHADILPNIFNKFVTKRPDNKSLEGNGLGLYLCRGIINAHGGSISAHNNDLSGATIKFSIPITKYVNVNGFHQNLVN